VDYDVVDGTAMVIISLHTARFRVPDLDGSVFAARNHPFRVAVKAHACDIAGVPFKSEVGLRIRTFEIVQLDGMMTGHG